MVAAIDLNYRLDHRYAADRERVYLTGTQALVRIMLAQSTLDRRRGLNTGGFVSGYRGSPLGGVDQEMWKARALLETANIQFQPAINEDLAATAILGTQKVETDPDRSVDGVFSLWYGKGPGVDRSGDALKHGNAYGSSPNGGVLVVAGDDHGCASSSMSHQSDLALMAWSMPVLHPASIHDYVRFGLYGFALSRFSGCWVGFKAISETVEGAASVAVEPLPDFAAPDFAPPEGGLHYRWPDLPGPQIEKRLVHKLAAVRAFARANPIDEVVVPAERPRLLVLAVGKAYGDVMEALRVGGVSPSRLSGAGVMIAKVGLVHPISDLVREWAEQAEEVLVIEEKQGVVERQLKEALFNVSPERRPRVIGKTDEAGGALLSSTAELRPSRVAAVLAARLARHGVKLAVPRAWSEPVEAVTAVGPVRSPYFCSGCPHNSSTRVPEGSRAQAGIGCHFMASWMDRSTTGLIQMGGEGVDWVGQSRFTKTRHVFQNLGDGTFFHSGHMAIRQAIAAGATITYKILYNDAVAMTGGQPLDGVLTVPQITRLAHGEGVKRIAVVSDEPGKYPADADFAPGVTFHHRDDLDTVQRELRETPGVTVLIYDQTCAAEKRRRRKRGAYPDPDRRVVINDLVCEGCGDCQQKSNCLSVVPVETEWGRKRQIDQSSCNKDFSCVRGFCPSFVTVEGGKLRRGAGAKVSHEEVIARAAALPAPVTELGEAPFEVLFAGVGGTGIVTLGAVTAVAAHLEGKGASVLDFMGFAQKGGQVLSHVRIARDPATLNQARIDRGCADALVAADLVVATAREALGVIEPSRTRIAANTREIPTGSMLRDPSAKVDTAMLSALLEKRVGQEHYRSLDAQWFAERLIGDAIQANMLLLGFAWQLGLLPVSYPALERAVELNGVAVEINKRALAWGRLAAADPDFVAQFLPHASGMATAKSLDEIVARRVAFLTAYQDAAYAERYRTRVEAVRRAETAVFGPQETRLAETVARNLFKLMAYKDEYEVARLYTDGHFQRQIEREFEGPARLTFHLAPPLIAKAAQDEAEPRKMVFGPWMMTAFRVLASLRHLRGTPFDLFGYTAERRMERRLIEEYERMLEDVLPRLAVSTADAILALASVPEQIRGFGPVKERSVAAASERTRRLLRELRSTVEVETGVTPRQASAAA